MTTFTTLGSTSLAAAGSVTTSLYPMERRRLAVDLGHLEVELVNVEHVRFLCGVLDCPLLHVTELRHRVHAVGGVRLAVDIEQVRVRGIGEDDGPMLIDLGLAQVRQLGERRRRRDRDRVLHR